MTKRCLFISAYLPSPEVPAAGNRLSAASLAAERARHDHTDLISFRNRLERAAGAQVEAADDLTVMVYDIDLNSRLRAALRFPTAPSGSAVRVSLAHSKVKRLIGRQAYDRIFIDFTQAASLVPPLLRHRAHLRVHDRVSELYRRKAEGSFPASVTGMIEYARVRPWEAKIFREFGSLSALTQRDADEVNRIGQRNDCQVEAPDNIYSVSGRGRGTIERGAILFWANFARPENIDAAQYLIRSIFPQIKTMRPEAKLILAGANPPPHMLKVVEPGIEWTGFVVDPGEVFRRAAIGVVPMRQGAGIKIKTLEFLASSIPTVATEVGAEGVPDHPLLQVTNDTNEFIRRCVDLLDTYGDEIEK